MFLAKKMDDASIRNNMRKARESLGISQSEMALRLEMSLTAYHKLENGPTRIMNEHVVKFASIAGMSLDELVNGYEPIDSVEAGLDEVRVNYENTLKNLNDNYIKEVETRQRRASANRPETDLPLRENGAEIGLLLFGISQSLLYLQNVLTIYS